MYMVSLLSAVLLKEIHAIYCLVVGDPRYLLSCVISAVLWTEIFVICCLVEGDPCYLLSCRRRSTPSSVLWKEILVICCLVEGGPRHPLSCRRRSTLSAVLWTDLLSCGRRSTLSAVLWKEIHATVDALSCGRRSTLSAVLWTDLLSCGRISTLSAWLLEADPCYSRCTVLRKEIHVTVDVLPCGRRSRLSAVLWADLLSCGRRSSYLRSFSIVEEKGEIQMWRVWANTWLRKTQFFTLLRETHAIPSYFSLTLNRQQTNTLPLLCDLMERNKTNTNPPPRCGCRKERIITSKYRPM